MENLRTGLRTIVAVAFVFVAVDQADAMSLFHHDNHSTPTQHLITNGTSNTNNTNSSINANPVTVTPEPSTVVLLASGLVGLGIWRLRQKS